MNYRLKLSLNQGSNRVEAVGAVAAPYAAEPLVGVQGSEAPGSSGFFDIFAEKVPLEYPGNRR